MMLTIVVQAGEELLYSLYRALSRSYEVLCVGQREILLPDISPDILLLGAKRVPECDGDVVYVLKDAQEEEGFLPSPHAVAVVHSQDESSLRFCAKHHLRTLTCGLSSKDTLTLSSVTAESAVICLQREIGTLGGEVLEPYEIPVKLRRAVDRMELLSLAAVLLLCGEGGMLSEPL